MLEDFGHTPDFAVQERECKMNCSIVLVSLANLPQRLNIENRIASKSKCNYNL